MTILLEPVPGQLEPEFRLAFEASSPSGTHVAFSGSIRMEPGTLSGPGLGLPDETTDNEYEVRFQVGPYLRNVTNVVPHVTVDGFWNSNSDEDDQQKWDIATIDWDTVHYAPNQQRIQLVCRLRVRGEESKVIRLGYHVIARSRGMGQGGLSAPGPVHS